MGTTASTLEKVAQEEINENILQGIQEAREETRGLSWTERQLEKLGLLKVTNLESKLKEIKRRFFCKY